MSREELVEWVGREVIGAQLSSTMKGYDDIARRIVEKVEAEREKQIQALRDWGMHLNSCTACCLDTCEQGAAYYEAALACGALP